MDRKTLSCLCDHCANNTCTTDQLCYAEWKLTNYDEVVSYLSSTTTTTTTTEIPGNYSNNSEPSAYAPFRLENAYNCYRKNEPLVIKTICNQTASNTSHIIRRCCDSSDHCNSMAILPTEAEAIEEFRRILPTTITPNTPSFYEQYSDLPLTVQLVIVVIIVSLIFYTSVLINQAVGCGSSRKRQRTSSGTLSPPSQSRLAQHDYSIKRMINSILITVGMRRDDFRRSASAPVEASPNVSESRLGRAHGEEASSNHDTVGYDTNSMASREPLIRNLHKITPADTLNFIHPHPHMNEEIVNGKRNNTLQMTIGSGVVDQRDDTSSGSGQGQAYLSQRSVSHDIQLVRIIGRGYFGVVWRGEYKGQPVAVKIFSTVAEASWERETEIYQTSMLRHKNILGLIATDKRHDSHTTGFWLVTDYYPMGSLFDFLSKNTISMWDAVRMAFSIANGLAHLHVEIFGTRGKPAIAHRDMKSKNILVKNDGTCCIADLGMAVRYNSSSGIVDVPSNSRIGTRRYLAPEVLEDKLNLLDFEAVKATDIYSFGLVLWEILRRTCLIAPNQSDTDGLVEREVMESVTSGSGLYQDNIPAGPWPPPEGLQQPTVESSPNAPEQLGPQSQRGQAAPLLAEIQQDIQLYYQQLGERLQPQQQEQAEQMQHPQQSSLNQPLQQLPQQEQEQQPLQPRPEQEQAQRQQGVLDESMESSLDEATHELAYAFDEFQVPYQHDVSPDPTAAEMYEVICVRKIRPRLSPRWLKFASMRDYVTLMNECWYEKPQARLTALRLRKSLSDLATKYFNLNIMEYD